MTMWYWKSAEDSVFGELPRIRSRSVSIERSSPSIRDSSALPSEDSHGMFFSLSS